MLIFVIQNKVRPYIFYLALQTWGACFLLCMALQTDIKSRLLFSLEHNHYVLKRLSHFVVVLCHVVSCPAPATPCPLWALLLGSVNKLHLTGKSISIVAYGFLLSQVISELIWAMQNKSKLCYLSCFMQSSAMVGRENELRNYSEI